MDQNYVDIFDEPVHYRKRRRSAGNSVAVAVVIVALAVILLLVVWQMSVATNTVTVGDDATLLLDQEDRVAMRETTPNTNTNANATMTDAEVAAVRAYTRAELAGIRTRLAATDDYQTALMEVEQLEVDLASAYAETAGATRESWNQLRADFNELANRLREENAESLDLLENLLLSLETEVWVEDSQQ